MYQQITIKTLKKQGKNNSQIAGLMGCHRNTVANVLKRKAVLEKQVRNKPSAFSPHKEKIKEYLNKGLSKLRIWEILKEEYGVEASYSALMKYCRKHLKTAPTAFVVQQTLPGEEAEVDFGYLGEFVKPQNKDGFNKNNLQLNKFNQFNQPGQSVSQQPGLVKVWVFIMTLAFSREGFYMAVLDQKIESFMSAHVKAFEYFGGMPKTVKVDNLKAAILKNRRYDLEFNKTFLEFSLHYGFVIKPCSPRQPQQKGKVESGVGYVKKNFLPGRKFRDVNDLRLQLKDWMRNKANLRIHGTTKKVPHELFLSQEKPYLQPLPQTPFAFNVPQLRKVASNCHIHFNNCYYSVPSNLVGEMVEVRVQGKLLTIYYQSKEITTHLVSLSSPGAYVTNPSHFPQEKIYSQTNYQKKYEAKMKALGIHAHQFFLETVKATPLWSRNIKFVLGLVSVHGKDKVNKACKRALVFGALKPKTIKNICEHNWQELEIEPKLPKADQEEKENKEGKTEIKDKNQAKKDLSRPLSYYGQQSREKLNRENREKIGMTG